MLGSQESTAGARLAGFSRSIPPLLVETKWTVASGDLHHARTQAGQPSRNFSEPPTGMAPPGPGIDVTRQVETKPGAGCRAQRSGRAKRVRERPFQVRNPDEEPHRRLNDATCTQRFPRMWTAKACSSSQAQSSLPSISRAQAIMCRYQVRRANGLKDHGVEAERLRLSVAAPKQRVFKCPCWTFGALNATIRLPR